MSDGEVHPLFPAADGDAPVEHVKQSWCPHRRVTLVRSSHKLFCKECGVELDPWERLSLIASERERLDQQRNALHSEVERLRNGVEELKRIERNAKARQRRRDGPAKRQSQRDRLIEMYPMIERSGAS